MNLVDLLIARENKKPEERSERKKQMQRSKWRKEGAFLLERRLQLNLPRAFIARETRINPNRLRRLEQGLPVKDAKIIYRSYELVLENVEMKRKFINIDSNN